jgi:hypothetical protein
MRMATRIQKNPRAAKIRAQLHLIMTMKMPKMKVPICL